MEDRVDVEVEADLRPWGNSLGVVIPAKVAKANHLKAGQHLRLRIEFDAEPNEPERLPTWNFGGRYDIDKILDEEAGR